MKKFCLVLLAVTMLTMGSAHAAWLPLYEAYPVDLDGNAWVEVPLEYEVWDCTIDYPCMYIVSESMQMALMAKIPDGYRQRWTSQAPDVSGFQEDGTKVLSGMDVTEASTVIERYTIEELPAARVDMTGQGYEMIWIADGGDMYFFMYPLEDKDFAADMIAVASTLHLVESNTAPAANEADYTYTVDARGVTITGYTGSAVRVAIPESIGGVPVTALGECAFYESDITWLSIPDSVTDIGAYCFSGCNNLKTLKLSDGIRELPDGMLESCFRLLALDIPEGVQSIGSAAFWGNLYLEELHLPASLEEIGGLNFVSAECLTRFTVAEGNTSFKTQDDGTVLLSADGKRFIRYCSWQERTAYTVPEGVEVIDAFAFADWGTLETVVVPEGVTTIEGSAFVALPGLKSLTLPMSAVNLGVLNPEKMGRVSLQPLQEGEEGSEMPGAAAIVSYAVIIAPEGSAAQAHAEQFNLAFEAAPAAENNNNAQPNE